jgi:hypothetical protein
MLGPMMRYLSIALLSSWVLSAVAAAQPPLADRIELRARMPGRGQARYVTATLENGILEGCISNVEGSCRRTVRVVLTEAQRAELGRLWTETQQPIDCRPETVGRDDRPFELSYHGQTYRGHWPPRVQDMAARNAGQCRAQAALAWWLAERMRERAEPRM